MKRKVWISLLLGLGLVIGGVPLAPQDWAEPYAALAQELDLPAATLSQAYALLASYWSEWELYTGSASDSEKDL